MLEIELSCIPDSELDLQVLKMLLSEFYRMTGVETNLREMQWGSAWADLMTIATHGKGRISRTSVEPGFQAWP